MIKDKIEYEISNLENNKKTKVKFNGTIFLLKKKNGVINVSPIQPFWLKIISVIVFFFLITKIGDIISFSYTDDENITHLFSGSGFLISMASKYPIILFAIIIIGGIFVSNLIYRTIYRKKLNEFKKEFQLT
jgi:hypothetical protein